MRPCSTLLLFFPETGPRGTGPRPVSGPATTATVSAVSQSSRNQAKQHNTNTRTAQMARMAQQAPGCPAWLACFDGGGCWAIRRAHARHCGTNGRMFPQWPPSRGIGLRRATRRASSTGAGWPPNMPSVCGYWGQVLAVCVGNARGLQTAFVRAVACPGRYPVPPSRCQPKNVWGAKLWSSQTVLECQIQWPGACGAETGRRNRRSAGQRRTETRAIARCEAPQAKQTGDDALWDRDVDENDCRLNSYSSVDIPGVFAVSWLLQAAGADFTC
jgi:hypothetical protein